MVKIVSILFVSILVLAGVILPFGEPLIYKYDHRRGFMQKEKVFENSSFEVNFIQEATIDWYSTFLSVEKKDGSNDTAIVPIGTDDRRWWNLKTKHSEGVYTICGNSLLGGSIPCASFNSKTLVFSTKLEKVQFSSLWEKEKYTDEERKQLLDNLLERTK